MKISEIINQILIKYILIILSFHKILLYRVVGMRIVCPMLFLRLSVLVDLPGFNDIPTPFPALEALDGGK